MGGANYMGGKRNAVKARSRDQVSRKQKGFFKRQKLDMLAKGLSSSLEPSMHHRAMEVGPGDIQLRHARTKHKQGPDEITAARSFIPSPVYIPSTSSCPSKRRRIEDAHTSSSDRGLKSEILDNLDAHEPVFLRKVMEQILATPDLACLKRKSAVAPTPTCRRELPEQSKRITRHSEGQSLAQSMIRSIDAKQKTPLKKRSMASNSSDGLRVQAGETPPLDDISDWSENDGNIHDSGHENNIGEESMFNSDWSIYPHNSRSSTRCNDDDDDGEGDLCKNVVQSSSNLKYHPESGSCSATNPSPFEDSIRAAKKSVFIRDDGETIYGRLFEDPDPWKRIGIILGLEKDDEVVQRIPGDNNKIQFDVDPEGPNQELEQHEKRGNDPPDESTVTSNTVIESSHTDYANGTAQEVVATGSDESPRFCCHEVVSSANAFLDGGHERGVEYRDSSPEVLAMPQLQEVNGKFLAPSIFLGGFEWEESEDE